MFLSILLSLVPATTACVAVDGDTLRCPEVGRVRLLGIDAPELHGCPKHRVCAPGDGQGSKRSLKRLVGGSDPVILDMLGIKTDQSRGINDPGAAAKPRTTDESRIKMLAEHVLAGGAA